MNGRFIYDKRRIYVNGKVASGIVKGLWYRVTFDFIPTKEEAIKTIERSYTEAIYQLSKKTEDIILSDMHFFK